MVHVEITNFQSIKSLTFDFEGFTTIVGRNFIGKSATLRAINAALTNQQGTDFIRWGEKFCEVLIKTGDIEILWHKENGNNYYKINNKDTYEKVGNQPPPKPIIDAGYGLLNINKEKINIFYAQQFFPLFLIDKLDTKSADILISIYGLDKLYKAIDLCSKDQRENSNLVKLRKNDLEQAEKDLERFKGFDKIKKSAKTLEDKKTELNNKNDEIFKLKSWSDTIELRTIEIKRFKPVKNIEIPSYIHIEDRIKECEKIKGFIQRILEDKKEFLRLRETRNITIPEENIDKKIKEIETLSNLNKKHETSTAQVQNLKKIKNIVIPEISSNKIESLELLKDTYQKTLTLVTDIKGLRESIKDVIKELEGINTELGKFDHCPACGASLS
jgi:DNA repair ATPase RecN